MANDRIDWVQVKTMSISEAASAVGFNINFFQEYSQDIQQSMKSRVIKDIILTLDDEWHWAMKSDLKNMRKGVYVISISNSIFCQYGEDDISPVIYIGRGAIRSRLKTHFETVLFDFASTLNWINFDIYMGRPVIGGSGRSDIAWEYKLIDWFEDKYGRKPMLNRNKGTKPNRMPDISPGWNKPLKDTAVKSRCRWTIKPHTGSKGKKWFSEITDN